MDICAYCNGTGVYQECEENELEDCDMCQGSGELCNMCEDWACDGDCETFEDDEIDDEPEGTY